MEWIKKYKDKRKRYICIIGVCVILGALIYANYETLMEVRSTYGPQKMDVDGKIVEVNPDGETYEIDEDGYDLIDLIYDFLNR